MPDAFGLGAKPPTFVVDVARLGAAEAGGPPLPPHADGRRQPVRAHRRRRRATSARRRAVPPRGRIRQPLGARCSNSSASRCSSSHEHHAARSTSCAARTAAAASSSSTSLFHRRDRRRDPRRHPRLPLLHLPGRRRHSGDASAAAGDGRARARRGRTPRPARGGRCSASTTTAQAERFDALAGIRQLRPIATSSRRSARASKAATFSTAFPIRPTSSPHAVVRAVAGTVLQRRRARHRCLRRLGSSDALAAWTCRRRRRCSPICISRRSGWRAASPRPGCEAVCCDGNAPLPFARGAFRYAMCSDAFMFIWTKRQFVGEMARLIDDGDGRSRARSSSATRTTSCTWSPSHGQPLSPDGYRDLFETLEPRHFRRSRAVRRRRQRRPARSRRGAIPTDALDADPALTIVASRASAASSRRTRSTAADRAAAASSASTRSTPSTGGDRRPHVRCGCSSRPRTTRRSTARAGSTCPTRSTIDRDALRALAAGRVPGELADLVRRRVILDLPKRYY